MPLALTWGFNLIPADDTDPYEASLWFGLSLVLVLLVVWVVWTLFFYEAP